jgi:phosphate-selective porin OprO/OprP
MARRAMRTGLAVAGAIVSLAAALAAGAQSAPATDRQAARIDQLEAQVANLAAEVEVLKRQQAEQVQTLPAGQGAETPSAVSSIANGVPTISSTDGRYTASLHAVVQFDAAQYAQAAPGPLTTDLRRSGPALGATASNVDLVHARELKDGDIFRRARIGLDGVAAGDFDYRLMFDFAGAGTENAGELYEGWVQYSGLRPFHARVGAFAPSIGLEDQGSTNGMPLLERSVAEDIARGLAAGDTRTGASIWGAGDHWLVSAAVTGRVVGVLNTGTATAVPQTFGDQLGFVARVAGTPLHGEDWLVHIGVHGSYVARPANTGGPGSLGPSATNASVIALSNTPELRVDGTKLINTGNIDARSASSVGPEFAAEWRNIYLQSEYERFAVDRTDPGLQSPIFHGYYVEAGWVITGERRVYNSQTAAFDAPTIAHPLSPGDHAWGAFELAARYSDMDLNFDAGAPGTAPRASAVRGGEEQNWTLGLNWYPNRVVRFMLDYQNVRIDRLSPCGGPNSFTDTSCAAVWMTKAWSQIGQSYQVIAVRSQFAF